MNVRDLRKYLAKFDQDAKILVECEIMPYDNAHPLDEVSVRDDGSGDLVFGFRTWDDAWRKGSGYDDDDD